MVHTGDRTVAVRGFPFPDAAARPGTVRLTLLGAFRLEIDGVRLELPAGAQRLLALLALRGRTSRSRLAGTLWPDTTEARALASLRTCLWRIHSVSDQLATPGGSTVELGPTVAVDVRLLLEGTALPAAGPGGTWSRTPAAQVSLLLRDEGGLLPDWEDDWLDADRERLRQMRLHLLEGLALRLAATGEYGPALEAALAALRMDGLRESAHRAVIQVHLAEGNVVEARRAYERCRALLLREAGIEPSRALTGLLAPRPDGADGVLARP